MDIADFGTEQTTPTAKILVVDHQPADVLPLRGILDESGQELVEARSGQEALERVAQTEFAVVLLDIEMPGIDGFETARLIRTQANAQHTPIIFLTAHDMDRSQLEYGYSLGAVDFLVKPLLPVALKAKVHGLVDLFIEKQRARREANQLRLLIQSSTDYAIFALDTEGHVVTWNPGAERIKGYQAQEIIGRHFSCFYPQEAIDRGWPQHELAVARREYCSVHDKLRERSGTAGDDAREGRQRAGVRGAARASCCRWRPPAGVEPSLRSPARWLYSRRNRPG